MLVPQIIKDFSVCSADPFARMDRWIRIQAALRKRMKRHRFVKTFYFEFAIRLFCNLTGLGLVAHKLERVAVFEVTVVDHPSEVEFVLFGHFMLPPILPIGSICPRLNTFR